jgi:orotate phosphoribosyltransferase
MKREDHLDPGDLTDFVQDPASFVGRGWVPNPGTPRLRLPNGLTAKQLETIATRGADLVRHKFPISPVYIFGIARRGTPIAVAITIKLGSGNAVFSIYGKDVKDDKIAHIGEDWRILVVDNTIKTGTTLTSAVRGLRARGLSVDAVLTFYHEDLSQRTMDALGGEDIAEDMILSIYRPIDIEKYAQA